MPTMVAYAAPAFVMAFPTIPVLIQVPALYGVDLGVGLALTGLVLLSARFVDSLSDPLVGWAIDRFEIAGARRKPWIAAGTVLASIGLVQLLTPPPEAGALHLFAWSLVLYSGWTMVQVPYTAWGAELSADYDQRTRITAWRETATLLGIVCAGATAAAAAATGMTGTAASGAVAWTAVGIGAIVFPLMFWQVPEAQKAVHSGVRQRGRANVASLRRNGPFMRLLGAWFVNGLANGIPAALYFIYLEYGLGISQEQQPLYVLVYFLAAILAIPGWRRLSSAWSKHGAWSTAMVAACVAFLAVPLLQPGDAAIFVVISVVTGAALGADLALPPALQADVVDYDRLRHGKSRVGLQFALWSMSTKLVLAASAGIALPAVAFAGFDANAVTDTGRTALVLVYGGVPVLLKVGAIALVWHFPLDRRRQGIVLTRLARRR